MNSNPRISFHGVKRWFNEKGEYHRDGDLPAIEHRDGTKVWWKNGAIHRDNDKPAVERQDGLKEWYKHGVRHREQDKPSVVWPNGDKIWSKHGKTLTSTEVDALKLKWQAIRNGDTDLLAEELLNEL